MSQQQDGWIASESEDKQAEPKDSFDLGWVFLLQNNMIKKIPHRCAQQLRF